MSTAKSTYYVESLRPSKLAQDDLALPAGPAIEISILTHTAAVEAALTERGPGLRVRRAKFKVVATGKVYTGDIHGAACDLPNCYCALRVRNVLPA